MPIELESTGIKVNAVSPVFTKTNLNGYAATETVEEGAAEAVRVALLGLDGPTGQARKTPDAPVVILGASPVISLQCFEQPLATSGYIGRAMTRTCSRNQACARSPVSLGCQTIRYGKLRIAAGGFTIESSRIV